MTLSLDPTSWPYHLTPPGDLITWPHQLTLSLDPTSWPYHLTPPVDLITWPHQLTLSLDPTRWPYHLTPPVDLITWLHQLTLSLDPTSWPYHLAPTSWPYHLTPPVDLITWPPSFDLSRILLQNIHFSVCYKPLESPGDLEEVFLIPTCPCSSHKEAVTGEITAHRSGVYTLNFDNTTSRYVWWNVIYISMFNKFSGLSLVSYPEVC